MGNSNGTFQTAVNYNSGADYPASVAIADVNGDGKLDVLVANGSTLHNNLPGAVGVLLGNGDGTLQPVVIYDLGGGQDSGYATSLAVADLNGDGKLDVAVSQVGYGVDVLLGNGDGTFQTAVLFSSGVGPGASVAVADVNGDGLPDILVTFPCGNNNPCPDPGMVGVLINTSSTAILSATTLTFAPQAPGTSSSPQTVTLTNLAVAALTLSGITIGGSDATGFSQTNNCPSTLAQNASCQIKVTFTPTAGGGQTASLNVSDSSHGSPQSVALSGTGQDFSLGITPGSTTVTPGQAGNYTMTVTPLNSFSQKVALTCSGAPAQSTCMVSPSSVTLNGTSNVTASIAVVTSGASARLSYPGGASRFGLLALWLAPLSFGLVVLTGSGGGQSRTRLLRILLLVCMFAFGAGISSCGGGGGNNGGGGSGGGGSATPPGNYVFSLTGTFTSGGVTLTHTVKTTLVAQ